MSAAIVGGAIIGGAIAYKGSQDASNAQIGASDRASGTQWNEYQQTRTDQQPWRDAGSAALTQMQDPSFQKNFSMSDFQQDPGYQFRMSEGMKAINANASARGMLGSGATLKALTNYSQNAASDEYQNAYNRFNNDATTRYNRLSSLAGVGQTANAQVGQAGMNMANNISANQIGAGNAAAAGTIGQANAINNTIGTGMNSWMQMNMMNKMYPQSKPGGGGGYAGGDAFSFSNVS